MSENKRQRYMRHKAEYIAANPTPYAQWPEASDRCLARIEESLGKAAPGRWTKGATDRIRLLAATDLAVAYWAVECTAERGLNYGQLSTAFLQCVGVGCHRAKAAAVLARLVELRLVEKVGNYSVGGRGNVYRIRRPTDAERKQESDEFLADLRSRFSPH